MGRASEVMSQLGIDENMDDDPSDDLFHEGSLLHEDDVREAQEAIGFRHTGKPGAED